MGSREQRALRRLVTYWEGRADSYRDAPHDEFTFRDGKRETFVNCASQLRDVLDGGTGRIEDILMQKSGSKTETQGAPAVTPRPCHTVNTVKGLRCGTCGQEVPWVKEYPPEQPAPPVEARAARTFEECHANRTADPPQDCNFPFCGCFAIATKTIEVLQECGWGEIRKHVQAAEQAAMERGLEIYIKGFEENWVVQDVIDAIRALGS
jgi:hypothetical protein